MNSPAHHPKNAMTLYSKSLIPTVTTSYFSKTKPAERFLISVLFSIYVCGLGY